MSFCCGLYSSSEPGILSGKKVKVKDKFKNKTLIQIFEERLKRRSIRKKIAITFSDRCLTYTQLNAFASCLARTLIERLAYNYEIENPDGELVIAVCLPMSEKAVALILAIQKTGAAYHPLDPELPENLLLQDLAMTKPVMLITDDNGKIYNKYDADKFSGICKMCTVEELWLDIEFCVEPKTRRQSIEKAWDIEMLEKNKSTSLWDRPVVIFHTRGFLDKPVCVRMSSKTIINLVLYHWNKVGAYSKKDSCCVTVSLSSCVSIPQIFIPLLCGCTIHLFRRYDVSDTENFVKNLSWRNITRLSIQTYVLGDILDSVEFLAKNMKKKLLKKLKMVICRGAFVDHETVAQFFHVFNYGVILINSIGVAETTGEVASEKYTSLNDYESKLYRGRPAMGNIMDNVKLYLVDENFNLCPDGTKGEICVTGDCLAIGYVNEEQLGEEDRGNFMKNPFSADPMFERIFKSGEFAYIQKHSGRRVLLLHGRQDSIVRVHGINFSLDDVKQFVKNLEGVEDAFIHLCNPGKRDEVLVAFVKLKKADAEESAVQAEFEFALKSQLPDWAVPGEFKIFAGCLPDCEKPQPLCQQCCLKSFAKEWEQRKMERMALKAILKPMTAEGSNQYG